MGALTADRRLWLTRDRSAVVEDGDPAAAFLLAAPGTAISPTDVDRLGLSGDGERVSLPRAAEPEPAPEPEPEPEAEPIEKPAPAKPRKRKR